MTKDESRAVAFMAILLGLALAARVLSRPQPMVVNAAPVDLSAFRAQNQAVRTQSKSPQQAPKQVLPNAGPFERMGPLDLNRATATELEKLPGVGPSMAQRIVARRDSIRRFRKVEDLDSVKGIGPKLIEKLRPLLVVH